MKRLALAFLLVAGCPPASASTVYYLVDYPALQADAPPNHFGEPTPNGGTDYLSGTITTDGKLGTLSAADLIGDLITFATPEGTIEGTIRPAFPIASGLSATPAGLILAGNGSLRIESTDSTQRYTNVVEYDPTAGERYLGTIEDWGTQTDLASWQSPLPLTSPFLIATTADAETLVGTSWTIASGNGMEG